MMFYLVESRGREGICVQRVISEKKADRAIEDMRRKGEPVARKIRASPVQTRIRLGVSLPLAAWALEVLRARCDLEPFAESNAGDRELRDRVSDLVNDGAPVEETPERAATAAGLGVPREWLGWQS